MQYIQSCVVVTVGICSQLDQILNQINVTIICGVEKRSKPFIVFLIDPMRNLILHIFFIQLSALIDCVIDNPGSMIDIQFDHIDLFIKTHHMENIPFLAILVFTRIKSWV